MIGWGWKVAQERLVVKSFFISFLLSASGQGPAWHCQLGQGEQGGVLQEDGWEHEETGEL